MDSCGSDAGGDATRFIGIGQNDIKSEKSEERRMQRGHAFGVYIVDADNFFALVGMGSLQRDREGR